MRALVTGACGFVGGYLVRHLQESGDEVLGTVYAEHAVNPAFPSVKLDITNYDACSALISQYKPDAIYHLAGIAFVPEAENNFEQTLRINVAGTQNLFRIAHLLQRGITVLLVSSAEVYGKITPADLPISEQTPLRPANNYSLSKAMAELVALRYAQYGHLKALVMRPFNHIGPGQDNRFVASSFAYQLAMIKKGKIPNVIQVGNLEALRDFTDVRDIVRGYRLAVIKGSGTYNLGSGKPVSIQAILDNLIKVSRLDVEVQQDPARMRAAEVPAIYGGYDRAKSELGWTPQYQLEETLAAIYQYWLDKI